MYVRYVLLNSTYLLTYFDLFLHYCAAVGKIGKAFCICWLGSLVFVLLTFVVSCWVLFRP